MKNMREKKMKTKKKDGRRKRAHCSVLRAKYSLHSALVGNFEWFFCQTFVYSNSKPHNGRWTLWFVQRLTCNLIFYSELHIAHLPRCLFDGVHNALQLLIYEIYTSYRSCYWWCQPPPFVFSWKKKLGLCRRCSSRFTGKLSPFLPLLRFASAMISLKYQISGPILQ